MPTHLATVIALVLQYNNQEDEELVQLQKTIFEKGHSDALAELTGLERNHEFIQLIHKQISELNHIFNHL